MLNTSLAGSIAHTLHNPLGSLLAFQSGTIDARQLDHLILFVGIAAISLAIIALFFLFSAIGALIAYRNVQSEAAKLRQQADELIAKTQSLVAEFSPQIRQIAAKVETITGHVEHLAALAHEKADEISPTVTAANQTVLEANASVRETIRSTSATVQDANLRTRAQISRVDGIVTSALNSTIRLGIAIEHGIAKPGREVAGLVAGLKAGFDVLALAASRALNPRPAPPRSNPTPIRPVYPPHSDGNF
jgi:hypothetical protein